MSRRLTDIVASMLTRIPRGWALGRRGGLFDAQLHGPASEIERIEALTAGMINELDPRTAKVLLGDFERLLGPDPCGRDAEGLSVPDRQRLAHQRWIANGGQSIPYFVGLAAALGVAIEIEEFWPSRAGNLRAGRRLIPEGTQFIWRVRLAATTQWHFRAGRNVAGQALGGFLRAGIECTFRRLAPEHTTVVFAYGLLNEGDA